MWPFVGEQLVLPQRSRSARWWFFRHWTCFQHPPTIENGQWVAVKTTVSIQSSIHFTPMWSFGSNRDTRMGPVSLGSTPVVPLPPLNGRQQSTCTITLDITFEIGSTCRPCSISYLSKPFRRPRSVAHAYYSMTHVSAPRADPPLRAPPGYTMLHIQKTRKEYTPNKLVHHDEV